MCAFSGEDIADDTAVRDECALQLGRRFKESGADSIDGRVLGAVLQECIGGKDKGRKI